MAEPSNEQVMAQVGQELFKWLQGTGEVVTEQAPLLVAEIARYGIAKHAILALGFAMVAGACYKLFQWVYHESDDSDFAVVPGVAGLGAVVGSVTNLVWMSKALFAPRLYILETIAELVKSAT